MLDIIHYYFQCFRLSFFSIYIAMKLAYLQYQDEKFVEFILLNRDIHQNIQIMIKILGL